MYFLAATLKLNHLLQIIIDIFLLKGRWIAMHASTTNVYNIHTWRSIQIDKLWRIICMNLAADS